MSTPEPRNRNRASEYHTPELTIEPLNRSIGRLVVVGRLVGGGGFGWLVAVAIG